MDKEKSKIAIELNNTKGRGISHVGVYIGDGKFVHASSAKGRVRVDTLREGYYQRRYVGAKRVG